MNPFLDENLPKNKEINNLEIKESRHPLLQLLFDDKKAQEKYKIKKLYCPKSTKNNSFVENFSKFYKNIPQKQKDFPSNNNDNNSKEPSNMDSNEQKKQCKILFSDNSSSKKEKNNSNSSISTNKNNKSKKSLDEKKGKSKLIKNDIILPNLRSNKKLFGTVKMGKINSNLFKNYNKNILRFNRKKTVFIPEKKDKKNSYIEKLLDKVLAQKSLELNLTDYNKNTALKDINLKNNIFNTDKKINSFNTEVKSQSKKNMCLEKNDLTLNLNKRFNKRKSVNFTNINFLKNDNKTLPNNAVKSRDIKPKRKSFIGILPKNDNIKNLRYSLQIYNPETSGVFPEARQKINIRKIAYRKTKLKDDTQMKWENENKSYKMKINKNNCINNDSESDKELLYNSRNELNNNPLMLFYNTIAKKNNNNNFNIDNDYYTDKEYKEQNKKSIFNNFTSPYYNINSIFNKIYINKDEEKYMKKKRLKLIDQTEKVLKESHLYNSYNEEIKNYYLKNCVIDKITENIFDNFEPLENKEENKTEIKILQEKNKKILFEQILNKSYKYFYFYGKIIKVGASFLKEKKIISKIFIINNYILDMFDIYPKLLKQFEEKWLKKGKKQYFYKLLFDYFSARNSNYINKSNKKYSISLEKDFFIYNKRINNDLNLSINALNLEIIKANKNINTEINNTTTKRTNTLKNKLLNSKPASQHKNNSIALFGQNRLNKTHYSSTKLIKKSPNPETEKKIGNISNIQKKYGFTPSTESFEKFAKLYRIPKLSSKLLQAIEKKVNKDIEDKKYKTINMEKEQALNNLKLSMDNYNILKNKKLFHYNTNNNNQINLNKRFSEMIYNKKYQIQLDKKLKIDTMTIKFAGIDLLTKEASLIKTQEIEKDLPEVKLFDKFVSFIQRRKINQLDLLIQKNEEVFNRILNKQEFSTGNTLLIYATQNNLKSLVELLLLKGADPNLQNKFGNSALHIAYKNDNAFIINLLLEYNAEQKLKNTNGFFPWQMAKSINN